MQVKISDENLEKIQKYRTLVQKDLKSFNPSVTELVNEGVANYFDGAIEIHQKVLKGKAKSK